MREILKLNIFLHVEKIVRFLVDCGPQIRIANMRTLKFRSQPAIAFYAAVNHLNGPLRKQNFICGMAVWPLAHTVTQNYTYQKFEIAHRCK